MEVQMAKKCRYCGGKIGFFGKLVGREFCSEKCTQDDAAATQFAVGANMELVNELELQRDYDKLLAVLRRDDAVGRRAGEVLGCGGGEGLRRLIDAIDRGTDAQMRNGLVGLRHLLMFVENWDKLKKDEGLYTIDKEVYKIPGILLATISLTGSGDIAVEAMSLVKMIGGQELVDNLQAGVELRSFIRTFLTCLTDYRPKRNLTS
jgi:hypothetical protein